jgi:hypothetical protein
VDALTPRPLLHIGYPKAASSFLQAWFTRHPQLQYVHRGVLGARSTLELAEVAREAPADLAYVVTSDEDLAFWKGPVDPVGHRLVPYDVAAVQARTCAHLVATHPGATVLVVTRGFASLVRSAYSQYLLAGGVLTPEAFVDDHLGLMASYWDYDHLLGLYESAFGPEAVVVLPYEAIRDDPAGSVARLEDRLGLRHAPPDGARVKPALRDDELEGYRRLSSAAARAAGLLPDGAGQRLFTGYARRLSRRRFGVARRLAGRGTPALAPADPDRLRRLASGAAGLRDRPDFAPYLGDYFLGDDG